MNTQRKVEVAGALLLCVALALFARGWLLEREARVRAEATQTANEQIVAAKAAAIKDRDVVDAAYARFLDQQRAAVNTPQQAAQVIVHYLPSPASANGEAVAPQPVTVVRANELSAELQQRLPAAPSYGVLTDAQMKDVAATELACDASTHSLATCKADADDLHAQIAAKDAEVSGWENAAKGGSKWQRFGHALKLIGCSAGGAAIGSAVGSMGTGGRSNVAVGSALGAGGGVAACSLF